MLKQLLVCLALYWLVWLGAFALLLQPAGHAWVHHHVEVCNGK